MSDERARRVGANEALYRQVNERIQELNETFATLTDDDFTIVCECGDLHCAEQIRVPRATYERIRANPVHFVVRPGHDARDVEHVIETHDEYAVVQKDPGAPARLAEQTDPRS